MQQEFDIGWALFRRPLYCLSRDLLGQVEKCNAAYPEQTLRFIREGAVAQDKS